MASATIELLIGKMVQVLFGVDRTEGRSSEDNLRWARHLGESSLKEDGLEGIEDKKETLPLEEEAAWQLFSMKAFSGDPNKCCPQELEPLARELVKKCEGFPLAIVSLAGLMSSKKNESEWTQFYDGLNSQLRNNPMQEVVKSILLLCYNDLPYRLKLCFLYCTLFPENYSIQRKKLIRLWIAEGFVEQAEGFTPEQVAHGYLMELISLSLLQVVSYGLAGRPKLCKIHNLMWGLAISTSEREKFGAVYDGQEAMEDCKARRLSIQRTGREFRSCAGMSELRTFLVFDTTICELPDGLKKLRVLDLEDASICKLPDEIVNSSNLRYLNLMGALMKELPESIGLLRSLETLDIRKTKIKALPRVIVELQKLRHLLMYPIDVYNVIFIDGTQAPSSIDILKNLQVLSLVEAEGDVIRRIGNMTQLTKVGITNVKAADQTALCASIQNMKLLHSLIVMLSNEEESLRMDALLSPPPHILKFVLIGKLERVPRWFSSLLQVKFLSLRWSRLEEDLLHHIIDLPNLKHLRLENAYVGKCLFFSRGFLKLKTLHIYNFPHLNEIIIEKGAMPNLEVLLLGKCNKLKTVPVGIEYLPLQELDMVHASMELQNRICGEESEDHAKVQHIPKINMRPSFGMF